MSWFDDVFSGGQQGAASDMADGYQNSIQDYQKALEQMKQLMQPYITQGQTAGNNVMGIGQTSQNTFNQMSGAAPMGQNGQPNWMNAYQQSPMAKYQMELANQNMTNAAAGSGMIGSGTYLRGMGQVAQNIASQDQQNYFNNMMQEGQMGLNANLPIANMGYGAASQVGNATMGTGKMIGNANQNIGLANGYGNMAEAGAINNFGNAFMQNRGGINGYVGGIGKAFGF